jgi:hypothetical protein
MADVKKGARMISAASQRIIGLSGHSKFMKAMTPTIIPLPLVEEALKRGCAMCDDQDLQKLAQAARDTERGNMERHDLLIAAIDDMVVENDPVRFGGTGLPKVGELEKQVGFKVKQEERDLAWKDWNDKNKAAQLDNDEEKAAE